MRSEVGRNALRAAACAAVLVLADASFAQVRAGFGGSARGGGFGGVRAGAPRMGGGPRVARPARSFSPPARATPITGASRSRAAGVGGRSAFDASGRTIVGDSGLTVRGSFADDNFRLKFRLGSPTGLVCDPRVHHHHHTDFCPPHVPQFPWYPLGFYSYFDYDDGYPIDGYYTPVDPRLVGYTPRPNPTPPADEPPPPTDRELGDIALYQGSTERAIELYRIHIAANPDDAEAIRLLGLALLEDRETKEGVAVLAMAYRKDPTLAERPLPRDVFEQSDGLRRIFNRAVTFGRTTAQASAWLAAAAVAQAEGRPEVASRMVERAREAGLEKAVVDAMIVALAK